MHSFPIIPPQKIVPFHFVPYIYIHLYFTPSLAVEMNELFDCNRNPHALPPPKIQNFLCGRYKQQLKPIPKNFRQFPLATFMVIYCTRTVQQQMARIHPTPTNNTHRYIAVQLRNDTNCSNIVCNAFRYHYPASDRQKCSAQISM